MEYFTKLLYHLNISTSICKGIIHLYQHCIDADKCDLQCINDDIKSVLIENLVKKPYETSSIIQTLQNEYNKKHSQLFDDIFAVAIIHYLELFSQDSQDEINVTSVYSLLSLIEFCNENESFYDFLFAEIYNLIETGKLSKDLVYLTLLPQKNLELLLKLLKYEKLHFDKCNLNDSATLFRYCLYKNRHWLFHLIENNVDNQSLPNNIMEKINLLKMIYYSNDLNSVEKMRTAINKISRNLIQDKFLEFYFVNMQWNLKFSDYLLRLDPRVNYNFENSQSCLSTISTLLDLKQIDKYNDINNILIHYQKYIGQIEIIKNHDITNGISELDAYNAYCLILTMISLIKDNTPNKISVRDDMNNLLKQIKGQILNLKNLDFQLEIFENIFILIFLQRKHIDTAAERDGETFLCERIQIQFITSFLKTSLKEIKRKHFSGNFDKNAKSYIRFCTLTNYLNDTLWRLELLKSQNNMEIDGKNIVSLMLSSPNTFIYLCLENDNFDKAHDVVQVFNMHDTYIAQEIEFMEKMKYLKSAKNKNVYEIIKFCEENQIIEDNDFNDIFEKYTDNEIVKHLNSNNEMFLNLIDAALTFGNNYESSRAMFDAAFEHYKLEESNTCDYIKFCNNIVRIFDVLGLKENISTSSILNSVKYPLNILELEQKQSNLNCLNETYIIFNSQKPEHSNGDFINEHVTHQTYKVLTDVCLLFNNENNYLNKLFKYLKSLLQIFYVKNDNTDLISQGHTSCIFDLLHKNLAEVIGTLISSREIKPKDLESIFAKLKLDLVYHIAWSCLPDIHLQSNHEDALQKIKANEETSFSDFFQQLKTVYCNKNIQTSNKMSPDIFLLSYIRKRNWLLAYLINKIYVIEEAKPDTNSERTKYFNNLLNLRSVNNLKVLFDNNPASTVLYHNIDINYLISYLEITGEISENIKLSYKFDWKNLLDIIDSFPERQLKNDDNLIWFKDIVLYNLISENKTSEFCKYVESIEHNDLRIKCIIENLTKWPGKCCIEILNSQLTYVELDNNYKQELLTWFYKIELYENIKNAFDLEVWTDVYSLSYIDPKNIFLMLLSSRQIVFLLKWIEIHKSIATDLLFLININYFLLIFEDGIDLQQVKILLDLLQFDHRIQICKDILKNVKKFEYLEFIIDYLITLLPELESEYKNIIISLQMFSCFNSSEHEFMLPIMNKPLLIIEQLVMNTRLEKLNNVLEKIRPLIRKTQEKNFSVDISLESIDQLLRNYAKKSLDFRGIQPSIDIKPIELKLMQSLDTVSDDSDRKTFVMPEKVPEKSKWIENQEAVECMCCHEVIFSMFNRRHHCRRCGRVICGNCSHKRMEILEYGSIPVRVCNDCYKQSQTGDSSSSMKSEQSSNKSGSLNCWLLSDDDKHNDIAREEFSYEYAPSVSLCLSILKLHSDSVEYPRFLLDQCSILLPYLQDAVNEIDFSFVIQMIKSLLTVAKMTSLNQSFKTELSKCNEMFVHIELLSLLIEKDCLELFRATNKSLTHEYYIKSGVLRRLRDKLLEQEEWALALEVSTKVGLDKAGVFAAWGKSCLKAGCLQLAREKFQFCLEKITMYETSLDSSVSYDFEDVRGKIRTATLSTVSENRNFKTPPLVNEIISVLESNSRITDKSVLKNYDNNTSVNSSTLSLNTNCGSVKYDPAVCVLNKLKNLKNITTGTFDDSQPRSRKNSRISIEPNNARRFMEPCFYNECIYYLMRYGSHSSILHFYIRHEEFDEALSYILENRLQPDCFIDIYMKCLEDGKIEQFQENMQKIDSTLSAWEIYLKAICCHLETNSMYHVLYQLQQFMCDYIRSAMTCIKFYQENANNFRELLNREEYLHQAQNHLKQELEQEQWVQVNKVRKTSTSSMSSIHSKSSNQPSLLMKIDPRYIDRYINTIWRQIEITKFLAECELENRPTLEVINEIFTFEEEEKISNKSKIPTLFDSHLEKTKLAVLAVVCGKNIEEGFGIAFRIIQDHHLKYLKIYCLAGKYLAQILRETAVIELINCIRSSGLNLGAVCDACDEVLMVSICALVKANGTGLQVDQLIKLITDIGVKVNAYIESKQLKHAYLLAVRHNRNNDIRKILREAERQNQPQIKAICMKRLNQTQ